MTTTMPSGWLSANQASLMAEVAAVRDALASSDPVPYAQCIAEGEHADALDVLCARFGLSPFERAIVVLCAAPELDGGFAEALAGAAHGAGQPYPTFALALATFADAHWTAISPGGPLRRWRLLQLSHGGLLSAPLMIDEWLLHALAGVGELDPRLVAFVEPLPGDATPITPGQERAVEALVEAWAGAGGRPRTVCLAGPALGPKRALLAEASRRLGWSASTLRAEDLPTTPAERDELMRIWERQALVDQAALMIEGGRARAEVERFAEAMSTPVAVDVPAEITVAAGSAVVIDTVRATRTEQFELWQDALAGMADPDAVQRAIAPAVAQFDFDSDAIATAAARVRAGGKGALSDRIWTVCRHSGRAALDELAQRLNSHPTFDDLVLPPAQRLLLEQIVLHVRHRARVYDEWQMGGPTGRGLGINALFEGPSGTGKTLAAEVLATTLALDVYRIDLSQVVSKYIGETEKNLRRIFDAADDSGVVLLFDEADALFGKRSEVRDSHDRYANVEISYLLARMESYRGLALLTTNMRSAIDGAFLRRLRFVVTFPFPGPDERTAIWRRAFPPTTPTDGLDVARLAQLVTSGGTIRNIALQAAFTAAGRGGPVGMADVRAAARIEFAKLERTLGDAETEGWA